jgi:beta-glucosidase
VAVIGPNADPSPVAGGGSGGNDGYFPISLLQGVKEYYGECAGVRYERGIAVARSELPVVPDSLLLLPSSMGDEHGVWAEYFNNRDVAGTPALTRKEKDINFDWGYGGFRNPDEPGSPDPGIIRTDRWSARWTGRLIAPGDGWYDIGCKSDNGVRIYLDGKLIVDAWTDQAPGRYKITQYKFEKGKVYDLKIEFYENWGSCRCILGMDRFTPGESSKKAVALARESDVVIMAMGLNKDMEGEAKDRDRLTLPKAQEELIRAVTAANANTVVVLYGATPIVMKGWLDGVPAVVDALYPGEEGGHALAHLLWGEMNPSGKLPLTFPQRWEDSPVYATYPGPRDSVYYTEGIFMGYRGFDHNGVKPLFPFGYGLSYTSFAFGELSLDRETMTAKDTLHVTFTVTNTGDREGDEVAQLYIHDVKAKVPREVKALKGYKRVSLKAGEKRTVTLAVPPSALAYWDTKTKVWKVEPGKFEVWIGNSAENILLKEGFKIK